MGLFDIFRKNKNASALPSGPALEKEPAQSLQDGLAQYKIDYDIQTPTLKSQIDPRKISRLGFHTWL